MDGFNGIEKHQISVAEIYATENGDNEINCDLLTCLYYFEHEAVNDNSLKLTYQGNGKFDVKWRGVTTDINYYDDSKPDTVVEVIGEFTFVAFMDWTSLSNKS